MADEQLYAIYNGQYCEVIPKKEYSSFADAEADTNLPVGAYAVIVPQ